MTYSLLDYAGMFGATFFAVFLLGTQSKNVQHSRYIAAVITSFGISLSQFFFTKYAAGGDASAFFVMATGGCLGIACSIWFSDNILKRKTAPKHTALEAVPSHSIESIDTRLARLLERNGTPTP